MLNKKSGLLSKNSGEFVREETIGKSYSHSYGEKSPLWWGSIPTYVGYFPHTVKITGDIHEIFIFLLSFPPFNCIL